ncbi:hypothetical protein P171DRAFT_129777 [Karstenula rhodostoma CBS 690.94]|uniref:Uncharacterized protein n=1 Tax=Karstenula rhodostoma CBS 690.94 TaxID=1392251 RepID=A0A9P4U5G2_9PLEO|nr:hypothetical protein P171DRAFT_129777 [Karstenula rhodostoma CBS 690.94]
MHSYPSCRSRLTFLALSNSHRPTPFQHRRHLLQYLPLQPMKLFGGSPQDQSRRRSPLTANTLGVRHRRLALAIGDAGRQVGWALSTRANVVFDASLCYTRWIAYKTSRQPSCPQHHIFASLRRSIHSLQQLRCFVLLLYLLASASRNPVRSIIKFPKSFVDHCTERASPCPRDATAIYNTPSHFNDVTRDSIPAHHHFFERDLSPTTTIALSALCASPFFCPRGSYNSDYVPLSSPLYRTRTHTRVARNNRLTIPSPCL